MTRRRRIVLVGAGLLAVVAVGAMLRKPLARWFETPPTLAELGEQIHEGRFDDAERGLTRFLARAPQHREGNLLMAQLLIDRPNPRPAEALRHLDRVRSQYPALRAVVLVQRGKALYQSHRLAESEAAWLSALKLNPNVPEAGWLLIQQYYVQGRDAEVQRLALELQPRETDPTDRVRFLLELVREDVNRLAAAGVIPWLEPAVKANPKDLPSSLGLARALIKEGKADEGLAWIRKALADAPDDPSVWEALLSGLGEAGEVDLLETELARLPASIAADPRFAEHRGRVAQERRRYPEAVDAYRQALEARPDDPKLVFRLARALRLAGREAEAKRFDAREADMIAARREQKELLREAMKVPTLGVVPEPSLYQRFAALRERLGKRAEALAWHRLVLRDDPENSTSRAAEARLSSAPGSDGR